MTDLVGRLARRAAGAPTASPRPRARFTAEDPAEILDEVVAPASAPVPAPQAPSVVVHQHPAPPEKHTVVVHTRETLRQLPAAQGQPPRPPAPPEVPQPEPAAPVHVVEKQSHVIEREHVVPVVVPERVRVEKVEQTRDVITRIHERSLRETTGNTVVRHHTELTHTVAVPVTTPAQALPPLRPPAPAESTVHITIGRVDVRADLAAPRPATPERDPVVPAKTLSLSDFLRGGR